MTTAADEAAAKAAWDQGRTEGIARAKAALAAGFDGRYTAQPGDTFASIAEAIYGDKDGADELFGANAAAIGSTSAALAPGHVIAVPYRAPAATPDQPAAAAAGRPPAPEWDPESNSWRTAPVAPEQGGSPAGGG